MRTKKSTKNIQKRSAKHSSLPSQDKNGGWRIRWVDHHGKRHSRSFPATGYSEAVAELERIKGEVRAIKDGRAPVPVDIPSFEEFVRRYWIPNRESIKRSSRDDASIRHNHLLPTFGGMKLNQITTPMVEEFKARLFASGRAQGTVRNILALLSAILHYAVDLEFLVRMPCKISKPPERLTTYNYIRSDTELARFLSHARDHGQDVHAFLATAVYTGLRFGELAGLQWSDVDLTNHLITVQRSFEKPPKSGHVRHVPILDVLYSTLRDWRLQNRNDLVFPNEAGHMHTPSPRIVKFIYPEVLQAAELPRMRFHDLRHTFASHWVMKGGDLFMLQKILGHSDQKMVQRYAHLAPEAFGANRGIFGPAPTKDAEVVKLGSGSERTGRVN